MQRGLAALLIQAVRLFSLLGSEEEEEPNATVEGSPHLVVRNLTFGLQPLEYFRALPGVRVDMAFKTLRQYAWNIAR